MWVFWLVFFVLMAVVITLMYCCLIRASVVDDEMEKAFQQKMKLLKGWGRKVKRTWAGVISKEYKGEENTEFHDIIKLFKIYRVVNWQMQIKINQVSVMLSLMYQANHRSSNYWLRKETNIFSVLFSLFMICGRLLYGVHWCTDIIGGVLLSFGIVWNISGSHFTLL